MLKLRNRLLPPTPSKKKPLKKCLRCYSPFHILFMSTTVKFTGVTETMGLHVLLWLWCLPLWLAGMRNTPTGWPCSHQHYPIPQYATTCFPSFLSLLSQVFTEGMKLCQLSLVRATQDTSRAMSRLVKCTLHILQVPAAHQEHTHTGGRPKQAACCTLWYLVWGSVEVSEGEKATWTELNGIELKELCLVQPKMCFPLRTAERTVLRTTVGFYQAAGVLLQETALQGTDSQAMWIFREIGVN